MHPEYRQVMDIFYQYKKTNIVSIMLTIQCRQTQIVWRTQQLTTDGVTITEKDINCSANCDFAYITNAEIVYNTEPIVGEIIDFRLTKISLSSVFHDEKQS